MGSASIFVFGDTRRSLSLRPLDDTEGSLRDVGTERKRPPLSARGIRRPAKSRIVESAYRHLKDEDYETVFALLHGTVTLDAVPKIKSKVIKMFISSDFTDMVVERHVLTEKVYPKLRSYCRDKYGVDFHPVDLRWAVPPCAWDDRSTAQLCLAGLRHCQETSIGPNFAVLFGKKPGCSSLPDLIMTSQFETLRAHLEQHGCDASLLDQCYRQDQNMEPSQYCLQNPRQLTESTGLAWDDIEAGLRKLLEDGASMAVAASHLKPEDMRQLLASVTEREVSQGLLTEPSETARRNCVLFEREITRLHEDDEGHSKTSKDFSDVVVATGQAMSGSEERLWADLKERARLGLSSFNCECAQVPEATSHQDPAETSHTEQYAERLVKHFYQTITALVDLNVERCDQLLGDRLYREVVRHWTVVQARCSTFVGREAPLTKVRQYLTEESSHPFVLQGESGVGQSSVMAKVASEVRSWTCGSAASNPVKTSVVVRFVGLSPESSSVPALLHSICNQIAFIAGRPREEVPDDYTSLKLFFVDLVQRGEIPGLLVILIDSLHQLSASNGAYKLDWIPARISGNVKIIVSTIPARHGILDRMVSKVGQGNVLRLEPLPTTEAELMVKVLLDSAGRRVTLLQWRRVQEAVRQCPLPLFVTLTFQEAAKWCSYDVIPADALQQTVRASLQSLFGRLEVKHGKTFVSRCLAYITAARWGVSESELADVLSLDDDVLASVFTHCRPPLWRLPPALWSRLYQDMQAFIVARDCGDIPVLSWCHEQFSDAARERYLSNIDVHVQVHRTLCDYYLGTWGGSAEKPVSPSPRTAVRDKPGEGRVAAACRHVPNMPLVFSGCCGGKERFNLRKMSQLPFSLLHSRQHDRLRALCLCNYEWLHAKLRATSVQHVLDDFAIFNDRQSQLVADVLRASGSALSDDPDRLGAEICGRLLPHVARHPAIRDLVRQCDLAAQMLCPLVPLAQLYPAPGGPLQYQCDLNVRSVDDVTVFSCVDGILMTATSGTGLKVWELTQGEVRLDLVLPEGAVHPSRDGRLMAILRENRHVSVYQTDSGQLLGHVDCGNGEVSCVAAGTKYLAVCIERGVGPVMVDMEESRVVYRFGFHSPVCALSSDERHFCFSSGRQVLLYEFPLLERQWVGQASDVPQQLFLASRSTKCFLLTKTKMLQSIQFDLVSRNQITKDILYDLEMRDFTPSHNEDMILCRAARCLYIVGAGTRDDKLLRRLQTSPDRVLTESLTTFSGAGFTSDDRLVVAARYAHLFVWNAASGELVRALQAGWSQVARLVVPAAWNYAVTLLEDNTLQVWNLNNVDADVVHNNLILNGAIKSLAVSSTAGMVACHGGVQGQAEVKLLELSTGRVVGVLQQAQHVDHVSLVTSAACGRYLVTHSILKQIGDENINSEPSINWPMLSYVQVWDTIKRKPLISKNNARFAMFDHHGASVGIVHCDFYNQFDSFDSMYSFFFLHLDSTFCGLEQTLNFPDHTEFVRTPLLYFDDRSNTWALVSVLQECTEAYEQSSGLGRKRGYKTFIYIRYLSKDRWQAKAKQEDGNNFACSTVSTSDSALKIICIEDLIPHPDNNILIADVKLATSNLLLILYIKNVRQYEFDASQGLVVPPDVEKGAVLYDLLNNTTVKHISSALSPSSDLRDLQLSKSAAVCLDQKLQVFDMMHGRLVCKVDADWIPGSACLALDGRYLVGLTSDGHSVEICRTNDGTSKGSLLVHGIATKMEVAEDGRTLAVGTSDGRVLLLNLVLELSDPYIELIQHLPSRNPPPPPSLTRDSGGGLLMDKDALFIQGNSVELQRLSVKIKSDFKMAVHLQPSFRRISAGIVLTQHARSQACCIQ